MARGWESKSVESQIEAGRERYHHEPPPTTEQLNIAHERELLELSRTRVQQDLAAASNPRYRELLETTLRHLNERLAAMNTD